MKFLCKTEFYHSGVRLYTAGTVYSDITAKAAEELIAVDKDIPLGALSFFTPVDEEAVSFVKAKKGNPAPAGGGNTETTQPSPPKNAELIAEAKNLGIKGVEKMTVEELKQVIEVAKKEQPPNLAASATPPAPAGGGNTETTQQQV